MQTFFPEFESGQVLTDAHLNQLGTWLNEQQQAIRRKVLGIGIVCGLEATREGNRITVGRGVALTSAGHLICQEQDRRHGRFRSYTLPVSGALEDDLDTISIDVPELLPLPDIHLWELLTDDFTPAPGDPVPGNLSAAFLADKVVMLLLEVKREALKNCDINDCSNMGARWVHTVRTLLVREADAEALWQEETASSPEALPRDMLWQALRVKLAPVTMHKLPLVRDGVGSLQEIRDLARAQVDAGWQHLSGNLQASFDVYGYLLRERFPAEAFPLDPWQGLNPVPPAQAQNIADLLLDLHRYDQLQDAIASYHEFLQAACTFEAICCPDAQRFPFHVLLGKPLPPPAAEQPGNRSFEQINFNLGAMQALPLLRHPFYPSMQLRRQQQLAAEMLDLYYRTWLLFQRYRSDRLLESPLRIMPSRQHGPLSRKAIPYYFALNREDDLHRNWHPQATRCGLLGQVHGHGVSSDNPHPLTQVPDDSDFYRVEGLLGRPLGQVMATLKAQQQALGIGFGIEPVFLPVQKIDSDTTRGQLLALLLKDQTLQRLFKCKLGDIDIIFLMLLGFIFQLLVGLIYLISRLGQATAPQGVPAPANNRFTINPAFLAMNASELTMALDTGNQAGVQAALQSNLGSGTLASFLQKQVRAGQLQSADILDALDEPDDRNGANAVLYKQVQAQTSGDLLQRVRKVVGTSANEQQVQQAYQSMRMLQQSEKLLQQASVSSIAQFDFDRFDNDLGELNSAWQGYRAQVPANSNNQNAAQAALDSNMSALSNVSGSALLSNLRNEFVARITKIFSEFMFDGYNRRFPGLEHLCGVPKGGTLVLAYTHKSLLQQKAPQDTLAIPAGLRANLANLRVANFAAFQPARRDSFTGGRVSTNSTRATRDLSVAVREAELSAEQATAVRIKQEAVLAEHQAAAKKADQELTTTRKGVNTQRRELEKVVATRTRLDQNTAATAADKRAATLAVREAETRLARESEKLAAQEQSAARERLLVTEATKALTEAKQAEERAVAAAREAAANAATDSANVNPIRDTTNPASPAREEALAALDNRNLAALLADDDPLNDLIVVADFCLPTYCCDSDCADLVPAQPAEPVRNRPATSISVSGSIVVDNSQVVTHVPPTQIISDATLRVLDKQNKEVKVKMTRGSFLFKVNPGMYTLIAEAKGFKTRQETVPIDAPPGRDLLIPLQRG